MKFVRFDGGKTGIIIDGQPPQVIDIAASVSVNRTQGAKALSILKDVLPGDGTGSWALLIDQWNDVRDPVAALVSAAGKGQPGSVLRPLSSVRLEAPLASPSVRIFSLGGNVAAHLIAAMKIMANRILTEEEILKEKSDGLPPWGFMMQTDTVVGPDASVAPPSSVQKFDYEGECAVMIGTQGRDITPDRVKFWGFTAWNDFSIRDGRMGIGPALHRGAFNWALEKNFDTSNSCGPWLVVDESYDVNRLRCLTRVNGEVRQDWNTKDMVYSFSETASFVSHYHTLKPGDMFVSGTGTGVAMEHGQDGPYWLKPGDRVEVDLEGVGVLKNQVRTWK
jgi:2-keto-4-pentenoate hydratase/2-oxohepta-3-ene-1,7-dioic acid hydratase in catechol pathway